MCIYTYLIHIHNILLIKKYIIKPSIITNLKIICNDIKDIK